MRLPGRCPGNWNRSCMEKEPLTSFRDSYQQTDNRCLWRCTMKYLNHPITKSILMGLVILLGMAAWPLSTAYAMDCPPPSGGESVIPISYPAGTEIYYSIGNPSGKQMLSSGTDQGYYLEEDWWAVCNTANGVWYVLNLPGMSTANTSTTTNLSTINLPPPPAGGAPPWVFT